VRYSFVPLSKEFVPYIAARAMPTWTEDMQGVVALKHGVPCAAILFEHWTPNGARMHWCIDDPFVLRHRFLENVLEFMFDDCGKKVLHGFIVETNMKSRKLAEHMGAVESGRLKDGWDEGVDIVIYDLRPDACNYYQEKESWAA
jgi:hypothetical protein